MTPRPPRGRADPAALPDDRFLRRQRALRLVTRGRRTGREHTIELWFASELAGSLRIYLMAYARRHGRGTDWYRNLRRAGEGMVLVGGRRYRVRWEPPGEAAAAVEAITRKFEEKYGLQAVRSWYAETRRLPVVLRAERVD